MLVDSLERAAKQKALTYIDALNLSLYYAWVGDIEHWALWFKRGVEVSPDMNFDVIFGSDLFDRIRDDRRFESNIARAKAMIRERTAAELEKLTLQGALTLFSNRSHQ